MFRIDCRRFILSPPPPPSRSPPPSLFPRLAPSLASLVRSPPRKGKETAATQATLAQELITRSLQLPHIPVTALSQTDLFLVWIYLLHRFERLDEMRFVAVFEEELYLLILNPFDHFLCHRRMHSANGQSMRSKSYSPIADLLRRKLTNACDNSPPPTPSRKNNRKKVT